MINARFFFHGGYKMSDGRFISPLFFVYMVGAFTELVVLRLVCAAALFVIGFYGALSCFNERSGWSNRMRMLVVYFWISVTFGGVLLLHTEFRQYQPWYCLTVGMIFFSIFQLIEWLEERVYSKIS